MEKITFLPATEEDHEYITKMILDLYEADEHAPEAGGMTIAKIKNTLQRAVSHSDQIKVMGFKDQKTLIGYALLCSFWSNEYGGPVLILDELYICPEYRNKGVAGRFITELVQSKEYVRVNLEVFPENTKAFDLYKRQGFEVIERIFMTKEIK